MGFRAWLLLVLVLPACIASEGSGSATAPTAQDVVTFSQADLTAAQAAFNDALQKYGDGATRCLGEELTREVWEQCGAEGQAGLEEIEAAWERYREMVDQVLASETVPSPIRPDRLVAYRDSIQGWIDNQRSQYEVLGPCIDRLGFSDESLVLCLHEIAPLLEEAFRLSAEIAAFSAEFTELTE